MIFIKDMSFIDLKIFKRHFTKTYEIGFQQQHENITNRVVYFNRDIKNGIDFNNNTFKCLNRK